MNERMAYYGSLLKRKAVWVALLGGLIGGFLLIGLVRYMTLAQPTHYHADFAVFIDGQRQEFKGPQYYQEIAACDEHASPLGRVHLHDQNNHLVHVHADVVTWSDLFTNLGWSLSNSMLYDGKTAYVDGQDSHLHFMLNGKEVRSIADEIIGDRDRLLVSYGVDEPAALTSQYNQIETDAAKADTSADPAACQGPESESFPSRLRRAFWF